MTTSLPCSGKPLARRLYGKGPPQPTEPSVPGPPALCPNLAVHPRLFILGSLNLSCFKPNRSDTQQHLPSFRPLTVLKGCPPRVPLGQLGHTSRPARYQPVGAPACIPLCSTNPADSHGAPACVHAWPLERGSERGHVDCSPRGSLLLGRQMSKQAKIMGSTQKMTFMLKPEAEFLEVERWLLFGNATSWVLYSSKSHRGPAGGTEAKNCSVL